jgi:hypothetical protein
VEVDYNRQAAYYAAKWAAVEQKRSDSVGVGSD